MRCKECMNFNVEIVMVILVLIFNRRQSAVQTGVTFIWQWCCCLDPSHSAHHTKGTLAMDKSDFYPFWNASREASRFCDITVWWEKRVVCEFWSFHLEVTWGFAILTIRLRHIGFVSALDSDSEGLSSSYDRFIVLCLRERHVTLTLLLYTSRAVPPSPPTRSKIGFKWTVRTGGACNGLAP